jgi:SAM-dependent methyltransferase
LCPVPDRAPTSLKEHVSRLEGPLRLHLGCGGERLSGFVNVDLYPAAEGEQDSSRQGCVADVFADIRKLGLPDRTVDEIFTSHTVEHFTRWQAEDMLRDWLRILKPGGRLVVEMPSFFRCVFWLLHPNEKKRAAARSQFYGNQHDRLDYETHRYVWAAGEFRTTLLGIGYRSVSVSHRTQTHVPWRDMRVVAIA